ncbi:MAG: family 43 glycosylhydrolase, partial [Cyclobacteriaceae bacterium]|nr:family 43 glycosylhydrolase [Cyclobacteriaceae bacterium HetDA_MAG_MS6]
MLKTFSLHLAGLLWLLLVACAEDTPQKDEEGEETTQPADSLFLNPIFTSGPDPWVFQTEEFYYLTFTTGNNVTLYRSTQMSDLSAASPRVIWTPPATGPNSQNIWAPEIHRVQDKWYVYYAADDGNNENHRMFVLENDNEIPIVGQWTDRGELMLPDDRWAIDGTIFE